MRAHLIRTALWVAMVLASVPGIAADEKKWQLASAARPEGPGPWPVVMLIHGCGGIQPNIAMWHAFFRDNGYASVAIDGFIRRGTTEICTDFSRVAQTDRVEDAYEALESLRADPGIDTGRAAIMGFSNGAGVAMDAASVRELRRRTGSVAFRAALPLYPECKGRSGMQFGIPVFIGIGEKDDWTLAASCRRLVDYLVEAVDPGAYVPKLAVYPDAHHGFDTPGLWETYLPRVRNSNARSGYGATTGGNTIATEAAKRDVIEFLRQYLR